MPASSMDDEEPHRAWVLVMDSNGKTRVETQALLTARGCTVTPTASVSVALEFVDAVEFDLVFLALDAHGDDALAAARRIRELERTRVRRVPLAVLASGTTPEARRRCLDAGADLVIDGPLSSTGLDGALARMGERAPDLLGEQVLASSSSSVSASTSVEAIQPPAQSSGDTLGQEGEYVVRKPGEQYPPHREPFPPT